MNLAAFTQFKNLKFGNNIHAQSSSSPKIKYIFQKKYWTYDPAVQFVDPNAFSRV
jgi:hypothetical protein